MVVWDMGKNSANPDAIIAMQYLIWAGEFIDKAGNCTASRHVQLAMAALQEQLPINEAPVGGTRGISRSSSTDQRSRVPVEPKIEVE